MEEQAFESKDSISVINILTDYKKACSSSGVHESTTARLFIEVINRLFRAAIKERSTMSSNDANRFEGTITTNAEVMTNL